MPLRNQREGLPYGLSGLTGLDYATTRNELLVGAPTPENAGWAALPPPIPTPGARIVPGW